MRLRAMKNKFEICDVVKIITTMPELSYINNSEGFIHNISKDINTNATIYSVSIFMDDGICWDVLEYEINPVGKKMDPKIIWSNKFDSFDIVKIVSNREELAKINNREGYVTGMSRNESSGLWGYGVTIVDNTDESWHIMESELEPYS